MSKNGTAAAAENGASQSSDPSRAEHVSTRLGSLKLSESEQRSSRRRVSWFKWLLFLVLLAAGGGYYAKSQGVLTFGQENGIPVLKAHAISRGSAEVVLSLSGIIIPETTVNVTPLVPGPIVELPIHEGDSVKKGDLLAKILDTSYIADLHLAEASLALAESQLLELENGTRKEDIDRVKAQLASGKADLMLQERSFSRAKSIYEKGAITDADFDTAEARLKNAQAVVDRLEAELMLAEKGPRVESIAAAKAEVERAKSSLEKAQFYCEHAYVRAPADGTVLERNAELGELSRSDYFLTSLCVIGDLTKMEVQVDVQERQLSRIEIGQPCRVIPDAYPDAVYQGVVERIQSKVNRQRGVVRVIVSMTNPDSKLISEMNGRVEFLDSSLAETPAEVVPVPHNAVLEGGAETVVYHWKHGQVEAVPVQVLGKSKSGDFTLVQGGLQDKDVVLLLENSQPPKIGPTNKVDVANAVDVQ